MDPKIQLKSIQDELRHIVAEVKAAGRELTDAECVSIEEKAAQVTLLKAAIERGEKSAEHMAAISRAGGVTEEDGPIDGPKSSTPRAGGRKGYLSFKDTAHRMAEGGVKALIDSGSNGVPIGFNPTPLTLGKTGFGLLTVLPATERDSGKYSYLAQSVRTNNAAVVAPGGTKPTSTFGVKSVDAELQVIAHLSEPIDRFLLEDNEALEAFLTQELTDGVVRKATALGVQTIVGTSGIQSVPFAVSAADSIYDGATAIQDLGYSPNLIIIGSADYKAIRKQKDTTGQYLAGGPFLGDASVIQPVLWGTPTLVSPDVPAGKAVVLDTSRVGVSVDSHGVRTDADKSTGFAKNQVVFRTEGRFGFDVLTPAAVALVSLSE